MRKFSSSPTAGSWWWIACAAGVVLGCGSAPPLPDDEEDPSGTSGSKTKPKDTDSESAGNEDVDKPATPDDEEPLIPPHVAVYDPDYPGLDEALVKDGIVAGCEDGYDEETQVLSLHLTAEAPDVWLAAVDGLLQANHRTCLNDGDPLSVEAIARLDVKGGAEDSVVLLDFSKGSFGDRLYATEGAFHFELGSGYDHFMIRGSAEDDRFFAGSAGDSFMMALSEAARLNLWVERADELTYSLGPGNDTFLEVARLNVGLYDVDTGGTLRVEDVLMPVSGHGGTGNDQIRGGQLSDVLAGGEGDDQVSGGDGSDYFDEGALQSGTDVINGGPGLDTISYEYRTADVAIVLCMAETALGCIDGCECEPNSGEVDELDTIVNFEIARSGGGNDRLVGTDGDDYLYGEEGDDILEGGLGSDVLQGGKGADELSGGDDEDICDGDDEDVISSCEI